MSTPPYILKHCQYCEKSDLNLKAFKNNSVYGGLTSYEALLKEKGYLDYSAILAKAVGALAKEPDVRKRLKQKIKVVIVDEYQDVNPIQEKLVEILHNLGASVVVVGDDDQTIYQWRGSDVQNIKTFTLRYSGAKTIKLQANFRSSIGITDVARLVIEKNADRLEKSMKSAEQQTYDEGDIAALQFQSPEEEAKYIVSTCKALYGTMIQEGDKARAISWSDMAVLVRVNSTGEPIKAALKKAKVPVVSVGMDTLFDAPEVEASRKLTF